MNKSVLRVTAIACLSFALIFISIIVSGDSETYAASTKKSTVYTDVCKVKNYVYCNTGHKIYRVNLKTKGVELIYRNRISIENIKIHKGYIYYSGHYDHLGSNLYRVKTNGTSQEWLGALGHISGNGRIAPPYVISGSRIYYLKMKDSGSYPFVSKTPMKMKLNGKNKKKASGVKLKMNTKKSNAKKYKMVKSYYTEYEGTDYYQIYLKTPKGKKIYLCIDHNLAWGESSHFFRYD